MKPPLVSIIIPCLNRAHLITETLDSVLLQSHSHWECIIVDDGSTDGTQMVVEGYCKNETRIQFHDRPQDQPKGANACRNSGFKFAQGDYIQWFDSDDLMHPDLLKLQLENLQKTNNFLSFCDFSFFRKKKELVDAKPYNGLQKDMDSAYLLKQLVAGELILNTQTVFIDKKLALEIKFDDTLHRAQDLDFVFRLLLHHHNKSVVLNRNLVSIRRHTQSITDTFKSRDINLVSSEIQVRLYIWNSLLKQKYPNEIIKGAVKIYLKSLKYLLYAKAYKVFIRKMCKAFLTVDNKLKLVVLKLVVLGLFYIFTGKGITAYQSQINKL